MTSNEARQRSRFYWPGFFLLLTFIGLQIFGLFYSMKRIQSVIEATNTELPHVIIPTNIDDLRKLNTAVNFLKEENYFLVIVFFCSLLTLKQTFSIPGSALLNILAGKLFGSFFGLSLVCTVTAIGASCCFLLSSYIGTKVITYLAADKVTKISSLVKENKDDLLFYLIFIRMVPFTPNWLLNVVSPIVDIPFGYFVLSVFVGLMPYTFVCVQAGSLLSHISSINDIFDGSTIIKLVMIALAVLVPVLVKKVKRLKQQ